MTQNQMLALPHPSCSVNPKALGNQYAYPANAPNTTPPMMTLWKCATRNALLWSTKSTGGTANRTPVRPPRTNVIMNATNQTIGVLNSILPRNIVNSQLKILTPVGTAMIDDMMPKTALTSAPAPMVKK